MSHTRTLTRLACCCCVLALVSFGARAQEPASAKDDVKEIRNLLGRIEQRLANQQAATDVMIDLVRRDLKELRDEVTRLQREMADLRNRPGPQPTTSLYGGPPQPLASLSVGAPASSARIRLVNTHFIDMSAVINGTLYTVPPNSVQTVPVTPGTVNYQVLQVPDPMKTRALAPNGELTLTLYPR